MNKLWLVNTCIAVSAAVSGSLVTLFLTGNLFPSVDVRGGAMLEQSVAEEDGAASKSGYRESAELLVRDDALAAQNEKFEQLQQAFDEASAERAQLADSVAQLNRQVDAVESDLINQNSLMMNYENPGNADDAGSSTDQPVAESGEFGRRPDTQVRLNSLLLAGVDEQNASSIQARQDQFQLDRLELFDLAEREGWIDTDQFSERLEELEDQRVDLRTELGDAAYDRYLFELGRSNRVVVSSVINGSAAQIAGLQNGDVIMAYANERIFSTRELQTATREGQRGESVSVSVEREAQLINAEIPRGPLGVTLSMTMREPL